MIMANAPESVGSFFIALLIFVVLALIGGFALGRLPKGDLRAGLGLVLYCCAMAPLWYGIHRAERYPWKSISASAEGIPVFYSFGKSDIMLIGAKQGYIGYGCLAPQPNGEIGIDSKYPLRIQANRADYAEIRIENKLTQVALITNSDGTQLFLWQPGMNIKDVLESALANLAGTEPHVSGLPKFDDWSVFRPVKFTQKGVLPTLVIVVAIQAFVVYLARIAEMPDFGWMPVGLCVAPFVYLLFAGSIKPRITTFAEYLERQVVAENPKSLT